MYFQTLMMVLAEYSRIYHNEDTNLVPEFIAFKKNTHFPTLNDEDYAKKLYKLLK